MNEKLQITAIVLTYNEENKIEDCLKSMKDLFEDIFIVDSYSTDKTVDIAKKYTNHIFQHEFENYGKQRNWALKNLPLKTEWVINIDADQRISENLKQELQQIFLDPSKIHCRGFLISRKTIFMDKWIKFGGHYPSYHAILFKLKFGMCEESRYDQHFTITGMVKKIKGDLEDIVTDNLSSFIERHNKWASFEATDQALGEDQISRNQGIRPNLFGNPMERKRFFKALYFKTPIFIRPISYFIFRYFVRLGFLDGPEGLIFHFLQCLWFRFLVDAKIYELKKNAKSISHRQVK